MAKKSKVQKGKKTVTKNFEFLNETKVLPHTLIHKLQDFCIQECKKNDVNFTIWTATVKNAHVIKFQHDKDDYFLRYAMEHLCTQFESMLWCSIFNSRPSVSSENYYRNAERDYFNLADKAAENFRKAFK